MPVHSERALKTAVIIGSTVPHWKKKVLQQLITDILVLYQAFTSAKLLTGDQFCGKSVT